MKIKYRVNDFRELKALWSALILRVGLTTQHNFIELDSLIDKIPCQLEGQDLDLGENRW